MFNAFLKVFRLEVLGDFDLSEMEGLGEAPGVASWEGASSGGTATFLRC